MPEPLKIEELNLKHKRFIKKKATGASNALAAQTAGFVSEKYGSYLMKQPIIRDALARELERVGANDERVANVLGEGLEATLVKKDGGREYVDYEVRRRYAELILKVKKDLEADGSNISNTQINIVLSPELVKGLIDSGAVTEAEIIELQHEPIREEDGKSTEKIDS